MTAALAFFQLLKGRGLRFYTGVPDSSLRDFCAVLEQDSSIEHLPAASEGAAMGLGIGWHLGTGETPVVYLQNSGLWNFLNPYYSLAHPSVYGIPVLLVVGWRGRPDSNDEPQHMASGAETLKVLENMGIIPLVLESWDDNASDNISQYLNEAVQMLKSAAIVISPGLFDREDLSKTKHGSATLRRVEVIDALLKAANREDFVVAGIGHNGRELYGARLARDPDSERCKSDFLCVGGMGYALQIALGVAKSQPERRIWCIEGDGSLLMHLGGAALAGIVGTPKFTCVLLDNECHASVGGQQTACRTLDYGALAKLVGFKVVEIASTLPQVGAGLTSILGQSGPSFLWARILGEVDRKLPRPRESFQDRKRAAMALLRSIPLIGS